MNLLQWLMPWDPSFAIMLATVMAGFLFIRECTRSSPSFYQKVFFWLGLASLYIALQTQLDYYAEHSFFIHRIQHSILHHLGPFLIALSGFPVRWKKHSGIAALFANPVVAVLLFNGLIILWLLPNIHLVSMLDWRLYRLMNWSMVLSGLIFWRLALSSCYSPGCRIMMMLSVIPLQIITGALLFLTPHDLYTVYSLCGRIADINPLTDQQIGGLILWTCGPMMSMIGILIVARREWLMTKRPAQN